jgi:hypothetical protein
MTHNHGIECQIKVIHEDGTEVLSEWIEPRNVDQTAAALRRPEARAYWLRERNVTVAACPLCRDKETVIVEFPLTDSLSPRSHPHDSNYLLVTGARDLAEVEEEIIHGDRSGVAIGLSAEHAREARAAAKSHSH